MLRVPASDLNGKRLTTPSGNEVWFIYHGMRHFIANADVYDALFGATIDLMPVDSVEHIVRGPDVNAGSCLMQAPSGGDIFLVVGSSETCIRKHLIPSFEVFQAFLFDKTKVRAVPRIVLAAIPIGRDVLDADWPECDDPAPWMTIEEYLSLNPGIEKSKGQPAWLLHNIELSELFARKRLDVQTHQNELALIEAAIDEEFYKRQVSSFDFTLNSPAEHYAEVGWRAGLDPSPGFSTLGYLDRNRDVQRANVNPLVHYLQRGRSEDRTSHDEARRAADGRAEWSDYQDVVERGRSGLEGGAPNAKALSFTNTVLGIRDLGAEILKRSFSNDDASEKDPRISIIIPCLNQSKVTAECLISIAEALPTTFGIEVLVADNASTDEFYGVIACHPGLQYYRAPENIGFGPICNVAAGFARGDYLFFLNNDAQVAPGCLEILAEALEDGATGMVGPKLVSFDGRLQEAGCILAPDGVGHLVGFGRDETTPRYNYPRFVEHVSGAAIMLRRDLFREVGGFDDVYAPAYCEDADLSLKIRAKGLKIRYEPKAVVAHHLSQTSDSLADGIKANDKSRRIAKNRLVMQTRWADTLANKDLRTIAFYLPQYHPIPENDIWWGKGFTEWANLTKAKPVYRGHNQPRYPADLGYYDLRVADVMEQQAALARRYGVTGFCYYYYYLGGKRILGLPLERMLETGKPDLPYCLCWANENWTRRWDGLESNILLGQSYADDDCMTIIDDLSRYFRQDHYIRVDGKPLILIYRVGQLPNPGRIIEAWRNRCRSSGIGEICVAAVESFELSPSPVDPALYNCDITVEFPIHGMVHDPAITVERTDRNYRGSVHDYRELALAFMRRVEPGFSRLRSVLVGWDSTPRHQDRSLILDHATPGAFQAWLEWTYRRTIEQNYGDNRIVFINAWNEWCEGSYLEPDRQFGHAYLQAVRNALDSVQTGSMFANIEDKSEGPK